MKKVIQLSLLFFLISSITFAQITIDGDMSDWTEAMHFDMIPNIGEGIGDSVDLNWDGIMDSVINPALDVKDIYVTHDNDYLYVRIDINENGTFTDLESMVDGGMQAAIELFIDTDVDTSTGLTWGWWLTSGDYWINLSVKKGWPGFETTLDYGINKFIGQNGADSKWEEVSGASCQVAVNADDNKMEVAIPRAALGETNGDMESTGIMVLAEDPTAGWVADAAPNKLGLTKNVYNYGRSPVISIDGDMDDWTSEMQFDVAPNMEEGLQDSVDFDYDGTMDTIINPALDIKDIYVTHDANYLYVRVDINEEGTFTDLNSMVDAEGYKAPIQLYFDVDSDSSTGLTWGFWYNGGDYYVNFTDPDGNPGLEVKQKFGILKHTGANGNDESFKEVMGDSCIVAYNADDNIAEIAIPRYIIGETQPDNIESTAIFVLAEDPTLEWVNDAAPSDNVAFRNTYNYGRPLGPVSVEQKSKNITPETFTLEQNYPNPFNPSTTISYAIGKAQQVTLSIFNILGQKVVTLVQGNQTAGYHQVMWNGKNSNGVNVPSGIYFYNVHSTQGNITKKMILMK